MVKYKICTLGLRVTCLFAKVLIEYPSIRVWEKRKDIAYSRRCRGSTHSWTNSSCGT